MLVCVVVGVYGFFRLKKTNSVYNMLSFLEYKNLINNFKKKRK